MVAPELVSKVIEHGFGQDGIGTITRLLGRTPDGPVRRLVADDGSGLPPGIDPQRRHSLGLSIVRAFARQLGGTFGLHPGEEGRGAVGELVFDENPRSGAPMEDWRPSRNVA